MAPRVFGRASPMQHASTGTGATEDLWIFGYGSLMWRPGFDYVEAVRASLVGYRRAFCVYSTHHRGTAERPGLVLGLDQGGVCHGLAFRVAACDRPAVLSYLRAREQINGVYRETKVTLQLHGADASSCPATTYVVERAHPSYTGHMTVAEQAKLIRGAHGLSGPNIDYLTNTLARARALGLDARDLMRVMTAANPYFAREMVWQPSSGGAFSVNASTQAVSGQGKAGSGSDATATSNPSSASSRALIQALRHLPTGPLQPPISERRRFIFRINREAARDPGGR